MLLTNPSPVYSLSGSQDSVQDYTSLYSVMTFQHFRIEQDIYTALLTMKVAYRVTSMYVVK